MADNYPVTLQHGDIKSQWFNPNVFITADNDPDGNDPSNPVYDPVDRNRIEKDTPYYMVANVENISDSLYTVVVEFQIFVPSSGVKPDNPVLAASLTGSFPVSARTENQIISNTPFTVPQTGHYCIVAWIRFALPRDGYTYPSSYPLTEKGTIDPNSPLIAQKNINVIDISNQFTTATFKLNVPAGIDHVQIERKKLEESKELLEETGLGDLVNEADELPRMHIYYSGETLPFNTVLAEELTEKPIIPLSIDEDQELQVHVDLPKVREENTGAIYEFKTSDQTEGVAFVLAYESEENKKRRWKYNRSKLMKAIRNGDEAALSEYLSNIEEKHGKRRRKLVEQRIARYVR